MIVSPRNHVGTGERACSLQNCRARPRTARRSAPPTAEERSWLCSACESIIPGEPKSQGERCYIAVSLRSQYRFTRSIAALAVSLRSQDRQARQIPKPKVRSRKGAVSLRSWDRRAGQTPKSETRNTEQMRKRLSSKSKRRRGRSITSFAGPLALAVSLRLPGRNLRNLRNLRIRLPSPRASVLLCVLCGNLFREIGVICGLDSEQRIAAGGQRKASDAHLSLAFLSAGQRAG